MNLNELKTCHWQHIQIQIHRSTNAIEIEFAIGFEFFENIKLNETEPNSLLIFHCVCIAFPLLGGRNAYMYQHTERKIER